MEKIKNTEKTVIQFKNCERFPNQEWLKAIFCKLFTSDVVTVGTLVRKVHFLLMSLAEYSHETWYISISHEPQKNRFVTKISCPPLDIKIVFLHKTCDGVKTENTLELLNECFVKDKWVRIAVRYAKFLLSTSIGDFVIEKSFPAAICPGTYSWVCSTQKPSILKRLWEKVCRKFKNQADTEISIFEIKVLTRTLMGE